MPEPNGYRIERWADEAPDHLIETYARARTAIHDAPSGESSYQSPEWNAERVREYEAEAHQRG